jgi:hypothetical protein
MYPPKYVIAIANKFANGKVLDSGLFNGGDETNRYLCSLGFTIKEGNRIICSGTNSKRKIAICIALIRISDKNWDGISNSYKMNLLSEIVSHITKTTDILVLPAGYFNSKNKKPYDIFPLITEAISGQIKAINPNLKICFGIDGRRKKDQLAIAIEKTGVISIARKFHHINKEINLSESPFAKEDGQNRYFFIRGKRAYLAVCYDFFSISQKKVINNDKFDFIIGTIHGFGSNGGESDFARKGMAGASKQWEVHSYASAVFSSDRNPDKWPSGVKWHLGQASVKESNYENIRINATKEVLPFSSGEVHLRYYEE